MTSATAVKVDLEKVKKLTAPTKRAAYSDRMAWTMAALSQLAYQRFDEEDENAILSLAEDLAQLTDKNEIVNLISDLQKKLRENSRRQKSGEGDSDENNAILRTALAAGDFKLLGVIHDPVEDTQGYVAVREPEGKKAPDMAVLVFRGTDGIRDWFTNLKSFDPTDVYSRDGSKVLGKMHRGFHGAYMAVSDQINDLLSGKEHLPLFITGHSLGGALATVATWYMSGDRLAACYTFGAPRVGNDALEGRFRTPIYRVVNGADPVPLVPFGRIIDFLKYLFRIPELIGVKWFSKIVQGLIRMQKYRHFGYQRYLTICSPGPNQEFKDVKNRYGVSAIERFWLHFQAMKEGTFSHGARIDKYHDMGVYRAKLRAFYINERKQNL